MEYSEWSWSDHECEFTDDDDNGSNSRRWQHADGSSMDDQQWYMYTEHIRD